MSNITYYQSFQRSNIQNANLAWHAAVQYQYSPQQDSSTISYIGNRLLQSSDGSLEIIRKTPAEVFGERVLSPFLERVIKVAQSVDQFASTLFHFIPFAKADNVGLIAWFESDCPEGWREYSNLRGRVAVGAGYYIGIREDGIAEQKTYAIGDTGGEMKHNLNISETPSHFHKVFSGGGNLGDLLSDSYISNYGWDGAGGITDPNFNYQIQIGAFYPSLGKTSSQGQNRSHNNMPPYTVLKPCEKTTSDNYASQNDVDSIKSDASSLQSSVTTIESDLNSIQLQVNNLQSNLCECPSSSEHKATTNLPVIGATTGILGMVFGFVGTALGCASLFKSKKSNTETPKDLS